MNARNSHCTGRGVLLLAAAVMFAAAANAQTYDREIEKYVWNIDNNVNGIRLGTARSVSYARLFGGAQAGGFRDYSDAVSSWNAGAGVRSLTQLERFSMIGGFSFEQKQGEQMCGSMLIHPGSYPVDVYEFTPGGKTLQTYSFDGGISVDMGEHWRIGAAIDFLSANYAKRKDLRHMNYRLDMKVAPGVQYHEGDVAIGLSYIYKRNSETVSADQIGTGESTYYAFLDKGLQYGVYQPWTGAGVHLSEAGVSGLPFREASHGSALQIQAGGAFLELEYLHSAGVAGEKQNIWFRFPGNSFTLRWNEKWGVPGNMHFTRMSWSLSEGRNHETVLEKVTSQGVSTMVEYGQNLISTVRGNDYSLHYVFMGRHLQLESGVDRSRKSTLASQYYPYKVMQHLRQTSWMLSAIWRSGRWEASAAGAFKNGRWSRESSLAAEDSGVNDAMYLHEGISDITMEYATAPRIGLDASLRCYLHGGIYAEACGGLVKAFKLQHIGGSMRYGGTLAIGYEF